MKSLIKLVIVIGIALLIAIFFGKDPGYALITFNTTLTGPITIETSVLGLLFFVLALFIVGYMLTRLWVWVINSPAAFGRFGERRRRQKAEKRYAKATLALLEGKYVAAEDLFLAAANHNANQSLCFVGAARAAQFQNNAQRRDHYLMKADHATDIENRLLFGIYRAELLIQANEHAKALKALESLRIDYPNHPKVLSLIAECYRALAQWDALRELMPYIRRHLPTTERLQLEPALTKELMTASAYKRDIAELRELWQAMPKDLRAEEELIIHYVGYLCELDHADDAEVLIRQALKKNWSEVLIAAYAELNRGNLPLQTKHAKAWATAHQDSPYAQLTAAKLCLRSEDFVSARAYLEKSIALQPTPEAYATLAEVLLHTQDHIAAIHSYRASLHLSNPHAAQTGEFLPMALTAPDIEADNGNVLDIEPTHPDKDSAKDTSPR